MIGELHIVFVQYKVPAWGEEHPGQSLLTSAMAATPA